MPGMPQAFVKDILTNKPAPYDVAEEVGVFEQSEELWRFDEYRTDLEDACDAVSKSEGHVHSLTSPLLSASQSCFWN